MLIFAQRIKENGKKKYDKQIKEEEEKKRNKMVKQLEKIED